MVGMETITKRCAVYTRKSSEEGLEQDFNSLHAQREACEAYITSQKIEGWKVVDNLYDDGGYSGGNIERPALQKLIDDIKGGSVDIIVVYKIDRLTRSLMDFAKLVEIFDEYGVTFVSVTQSFNTTTSMGRLTLNVLLSFAQFEREVTGERIRDKIAASKKKGMWMGGLPPLGYTLDNRCLYINKRECEIVRMIFNQYLQCGTVANLYKQLQVMNETTPIKTSLKGNRYGGKSYSRGYLYTLLRNPVYLGKIVHKDKVHDGLHEPIIDQDLFDKVQKSLDENKINSRTISSRQGRHILKGILYDRDDIVYTPTYTVKGEKRYSYYVSQNLLQYNSQSSELPARIPAQGLDETILNEAILYITKNILDIYPDLTPDIHEDIIQLLQNISDNDTRSFLEKVIIDKDSVVITINTNSFNSYISDALHMTLMPLTSDHITFKTAFNMHIGKSGKRIIRTHGNNDQNSEISPDQKERVVKGIVWRDEHFSGKTIKDIASENKHGLSYVYKCIDESFSYLMSET